MVLLNLTHFILLGVIIGLGPDLPSRQATPASLKACSKPVPGWRAWPHRTLLSLQHWRWVSTYTFTQCPVLVTLYGCQCYSVAQSVMLDDESFPEDEFSLVQGLLTASWDKIAPYPTTCACICYKITSFHFNLIPRHSKAYVWGLVSRLSFFDALFCLCYCWRIP